MEQSLVKQNSISPFLSGTELDYVRARTGLKVTELDETEATNTILQFINRAMIELGQTPSGNNAADRSKYLLAMAKLIINDVRYYFPYITLKEIDQAIKRGIRKEFGEYFGFNVIAVHQFIEGYLASEERNNALCKQNRYLAQENVVEEPPEEEKERLMKEGLEKCYQYFKQTGRIIDFGNVNYQYLVDQGKINLSNEEKQEIYREAEQQIQVEMMMEENSIQHLFKRRVMKGDIKPLVVGRAKEVALRNYFKVNR